MFIIKVYEHILMRKKIVSNRSSMYKENERKQITHTVKTWIFSLFLHLITEEKLQFLRLNKKNKSM